MNNNDESLKSFKNINLKELELKVEHQETDAAFLDLDITIKDNIFSYKLFDKRDKFSFFIVRMPHLSSNIHSSVFYGLFYSELLQIARCKLLFSDFTPKVSGLYKRMVFQGGNTKQLQNHTFH